MNNDLARRITVKEREEDKKREREAGVVRDEEGRGRGELQGKKS